MSNKVVVIRSAKDRLKPSEIVFCEEYVKTYNASEAYRRMRGINKGENQNVRIMAWKMMQKPEVKEYIKELKNNLAELSMISRFKVLDEYSKIAFASIGNFQKDWLTVTEFENLTAEQKAVIAEIKVAFKQTFNKKGEIIANVPIITFKLHDKIRALDSIARMLGYDEPTKVQLEGIIPSPPAINIFQGDAPPLSSSEDEVKDV